MSIIDVLVLIQHPKLFMINLPNEKGNLDGGVAFYKRHDFPHELYALYLTNHTKHWCYQFAWLLLLCQHEPLAHLHEIISYRIMKWHILI